MFQELNPLIHSQLRLSIMTLLAAVAEADFNYLRERTKATAGNLSVQLDKLSRAGYIHITKEFVGRKSHTVCRLTDDGRRALEEYVAALKSYLNL